MTKTQIILMFMMLLALHASAQIDDKFLDDLREPPNPFTKSRIFDYINNENLNPDDYEGYYQRGILNIENGFYEEAIKYFRYIIIPQQDIVGGQAGFAEPYFYIGVCKSMLGGYDSAMYFFNKTIEIDPLYIEAYNERGILFLSRGEYKNALQDFEFSNMHNTQSPQPPYNIGYCHFLLGDDRKAKKTLKGVMKDFPDYYRSYLLYGHINSLKGKYNKAEKNFSQAVELNPGDPLTHYSRGFNRIRMGLSYFDREYIAAAYTDMQHVLLLDSTFVNAYSMSFFVKVILDETDVALENLYMAKKYLLNDSMIMAKTTPRELEEYYLLGKVYDGHHATKNEKNLTKTYFKSLYRFNEDVDIGPIQKYLKHSPSSLFVNRLLAYHYLMNEGGEKLEGALDNVLTIDGSILHLQSIRAGLMIKNGDEEIGYELFEELIDKNPEYAYLSFTLGSKYLKNKAYEKAIACFNMAIEKAPDYESAYVLRMEANANVGKYRDALNDALLLLMVEERYYYPWYIAGYVYNRLNEPDSAINVLNIAIRLKPQLESLYVEKAKSYIQLGDYDGAMEVYEIVIKDLGSPAIGYYKRGKLLQEYLEKPDEALKDFSKARELDPDNSLYHKAIGDCYNYKKEEYLIAINHYKTAMLLNSDDISLYTKTSWAFLKLNENDSAMCYLEKALAIDSLNAFVWYSMGRANRDLEKYEKAIDCYLKATELDTTYVSAYGNAGWTFYLNGEFEKCIEYSEIAVSLDDEAYYAMANIALTQLRMGKLEEAERLYQEYHEIVSEVEGYDNSGAIADLEELINEGIMANEAKKILKDYFGITE